MKIRFQIISFAAAACLAAATVVKAESDFTFKGFSLGMSLDDAEKLIKEKYSNAFGEVTTGQIPDQMRLVFAMSGSKAKYMIAIAAFGIPLPVVEADSQKKVTAFRFPSGVVDKLFNSGDMPARNFAQQFLHSYNLPEFKASSFSVMIGAKETDG